MFEFYRLTRMPIACLLITIYVTILFKRKQQLRTSTSASFLCMTIFGIVHILSAVVTEYTVNNRETVAPALNFAAHVVFLASITAFLMMVLVYTVHCVEKACRKSLRSTLATIYAISVLFMLAEAVCPIEYKDTQFGSYSLGIKAYCLYGFVAFFFGASAYLLVHFRKQLRYEKRGALFTAVFVIVVIGTIQIFFPYILLTSLGATMILLNFMLTLEDSQLYASPNSTLYNENGCDELVKELLVEGKKFKLGVYAFSGDPERIILAMISVQKMLPEKESHCVCCTLGDNLLVVVPMRKFFYGHHELPAKLPEHKPLNSGYSCVLEIMEFGDVHSLSEVTGKILTVRDKFNEKMRQQDELTETMGRTFFTQYTEQMISESQDFSFLIMDLDNFKNINHTYGHTIGDEVLKNTADFLRSVLRTTDCICRMGGDEFAVILPGVTNTAKILDISNRIRENLILMTVSDGTKISVYCSIGVHISDEYKRGESFHDIYAEADRALYRAKNSGRNRLVFARDIENTETDQL